MGDDVMLIGLVSTLMVGMYGYYKEDPGWIFGAMLGLLYLLGKYGGLL